HLKKMEQMFGRPVSCKAQSAWSPARAKRCHRKRKTPPGENREALSVGRGGAGRGRAALGRSVQCRVGPEFRALQRGLERDAVFGELVNLDTGLGGAGGGELSALGVGFGGGIGLGGEVPAVFNEVGEFLAVVE